MKHSATPRELEVLDLLARGCSNAEIAARLNIGLRTVKGHIAQLAFKYQVPEGRCPRVALACAAIADQRGTADIRVPAFTAKRLRVIDLIVQAFSNRDIANDIGTTPQVIKNLLREIYDLTGCSSRLELALWMVRAGIRRDTVAA